MGAGAGSKAVAAASTATTAGAAEAVAHTTKYTAMINKETEVSYVNSDVVQSRREADKRSDQASRADSDGRGREPEAQGSGEAGTAVKQEAGRAAEAVATMNQTPPKDRFELNDYHKAWIKRQEKTMAESMPISYEEACQNAKIGMTKVKTEQTEPPAKG